MSLGYDQAISADVVDRIWVVRSDMPKSDALPKWRLKRVTEYINENLENPLRLSDLATAAGLSPMYFAARFRAATGHRPHDYVLICRVERAQRLMQDTDLALAEIALIVGFRAQAHFTEVFKRIVGQTPAKWRQTVKQRDGALIPRGADKETPELNDCDAPLLASETFTRHANFLRARRSDLTAVARGQERPGDIGRVLRVIDDELSDGQTWVMASGPTAADIGLYFYLARAQTTDADLRSYPNVRNWLSRVGAFFESDL
jgi:AraC-like DNA-binding protein